jgi:Gylcosyl hydrolase family 115 C-terminal domain
MYRFPSLDSTGWIRVGVGVDDLPTVVLESPTTDEHRCTWEDAVVENVERLRLRLPYIDAGHHLIRLHALDEWVGFSKLVLYTADRQPTGLGPSSSARTDRPHPSEPDPAPDVVRLDVLHDVRRTMYRSGPERLAPHPMVYVARRYWHGDTTFRRNEVLAQTTLGPVRFIPTEDGTKDVAAALGSGPVVEHDGVIAIEAERALLGTADGWITPSLDEPRVTWTHTQAETDGGTGLAMHVDAVGRSWDDPLTARGLHVRLVVSTPGTYRVWALVKFDGDDDDSCVLALDGTPQPVSEQFSGGDLFSFGPSKSGSGPSSATCTSTPACTACRCSHVNHACASTAST